MMRVRFVPRLQARFRSPFKEIAHVSSPDDVRLPAPAVNYQILVGLSPLTGLHAMPTCESIVALLIAGRGECDF